MDPIYLDYNRTTPLAPTVLEAMRPFWSEHFMLPEHDHAEGRAVADAVQNARERVALLLGCDAFEVVFTSGGTEANNLAVLGRAAHLQKESIPDDDVSDVAPKNHLILSSLENDSICRAAEHLEQQSGWEVDVVHCNGSGIVTPSDIESLLRPETRLVCVQAANGVLGTVQPVRQIADLCHSRGVAVHCDATQFVGKSPIEISSLRADTVTISGHRIYGPKGTGALYVRRGYSIAPIAFGHAAEMGLRAGSDNVPGWIGLGAAAMLANRAGTDMEKRLGELVDIFIGKLREQHGSRVHVHCEHAPRLPNTVAIRLPSLATKVLQEIDDVVCGSGRCFAPPDHATRCLRAIGLNDDEVGKTVCISLGWTTSQDQIEAAAAKLALACQS